MSHFPGIFPWVSYLLLMESDLELEERRPPEQPKLRSCLSCQDKFVSAWSGERICKRCRSSAAWRNGY
jgi:hypothetical protein